jgi:carboxypeptidase Q
MHKKWLILLPAFAALSICAFSQTSAPVSAETRAAVSRLVGDIMVNGQNYEYDRQLADTIGPRLTASANYERAVAWAQQQFKQMGVTNVHTEPFTMPAAWEPEVPAVGKMTAPRVQQLHIYSMGWSPSTPSAGVKGDVYYCSRMVPAGSLDGAKIRGKVVLLDRASITGTAMAGLAPFSQILDSFRKLHELGAQAVIFPGNTNGSESASAFTFTGELSPLPVAQLGREDELLIKRLLDAGLPVQVEFSFKNRIRENVATENVVAEIKGSAEPDSIVIVGGHLDSWHPGTGAQDNGTGATGVMEVARAVQALAAPPRRTMRFILFGGEEEGLVGSTAYSKAHRDEMSKIDAVIITDTGSEQAKGFYLMGRNDEKSAMAPYEPLLAGLGGDKTTDDVEFMFQSDHAGMEMMGVPELVLWTDTTKYFKLHHKASDTFDSVDQHDFTQGVSVLAATSYAIADSAAPFAKHLSQEQVEGMLKDVKQLETYEDMRKLGVF